MNPLATEFPDRLLTLCDGRPGLRGTLQIVAQPPSADEIKNQNSKIQNPDAAILDFVASDESLDRYGEIILASGWRLENYQRNPVFQNSHQYGDILFTLGKALITEIRTAPSPFSLLPSPCLFQRIEFAVDVNPMARIAYGLYKYKFLHAVSVGFIPLRWQNADDASGRSAELRSAVSQSCTLPGVNPAHVLGFDPAFTPDTGLSAPQVSGPVVSSPVVSSSRTVPPPFRRKYLEQELLEVSAVAIPANPNALALALKSGAVEKSDLRETLDLLRNVCASPADHAPRTTHHAQPMPPSLSLEELLTLTRDLKKLLL
jgi:hypothetical protein